MLLLGRLLDTYVFYLVSRMSRKVHMQNFSIKLIIYLSLLAFIYVFFIVQGQTQELGFFFPNFMFVCLFLIFKNTSHGAESECPKTYHGCSSRFRETGDSLWSRKAITDQLRCFSFRAQACTVRLHWPCTCDVFPSGVIPHSPPSLCLPCSLSWVVNESGWPGAPCTSLTSALSQGNYTNYHTGALNWKATMSVQTVMDASNLRRGGAVPWVMKESFV